MCSVCGAPGYAKGLCERDYARARRGLSPTPHALRVTTVEQAFACYARPIPSGCVEWSGSRDSGGYGTVSVTGSNRKAHRIAYEWSGNRRERTRLAGNAVTPPAARDIVGAVAAALA